jgi:hypothetical protein
MIIKKNYMEKRNIIIGILAIGLIIYLYHTETPTSDNKLKAAFKDTFQHSAMADVAELACFPTKRYDCGLENGCVAEIPSTYYFIDHGTEKGTYFRCDAGGCDSYPVEVVKSGIFTQFIPSLGQAMLFKVADNGDFIDIATIGTTAIVSTGQCEGK